MKSAFMYLVFGLGILGFLAFFLNNNGVPDKLRKLAQVILIINFILVVLVSFIALINN